MVASSYFGTSGPFSAFTIAFQVPNLIRALVADSALERRVRPRLHRAAGAEASARRRSQLAGALFGLILVVLGAITVVFILVAPWIIPPLTGNEFTPELDELTVGLSRVLFPIVLLLGLNGLVVGILNAYDHFAIPAISPVVWNLVIIVGLVALKPLFHGPNQVYAYAIGDRPRHHRAVRDVPAGAQARRLPPAHLVPLARPAHPPVLVLMLPVTLGLGLINFDALINSSLGSLVSRVGAGRDRPRVPPLHAAAGHLQRRGRDRAVPDALAASPRAATYDGLRRTSGNGVRQIALLLIPAAVVTAVLAEPLTRLVYQRGAFGASSTDEVSEALFWFSLLAAVQRRQPDAHAHVLLAPAPVVPDRAGGRCRCVVNVGVSLALYEPFGHRRHRHRHGRGERGDDRSRRPVFLRRQLHGFEIGRTLRGGGGDPRRRRAARGRRLRRSGTPSTRRSARSLLAPARLGRARARASAALVYAGAVLALRIPEAHQIVGLIRGRLGRGAS